MTLMKIRSLRRAATNYHQVTIESFYKIGYAENIALTLTLQCKTLSFQLNAIYGPQLEKHNLNVIFLFQEKAGKFSRLQ